MRPERYNIAQGVTLDVITTDKFKTAQLSVNFLYLLRAETAAKNALLPAVLLRGTATHPTMDAITRRLQELYSTSISPSNYKRGETQIFGLCANFIDDRYTLDETNVTEGSLDMLHELLFSPKLADGAFLPEYVSGESTNLINKINAQINNKSTYAVTRCREEMCRGEAYGISELGRAEEVSAITPASLYAHYRALLETAPIHIFYVGPQSGPELLPKIQALFSALPQRRPVSLGTAVLRESPGFREIVDHEPVAQAKLSIGFRTGHVLSDGDYSKFSAFCELYGGGSTSKLFMNVREKLSLCYYCQSIPEAHKGLMIVASGIEAEKRDEAQREILAQLDAIRRGEIGDEEFDGAIKSLSGEYRRICDSPDMLEAWYISRMLAGRDDSPEDAAASLAAVTKDDIVGVSGDITLDTIYVLMPDEKEAADRA